MTDFKLKVAAQYSVHPTPREHRGRDGGTRRVFRQFLWLKPVLSKRHYLVPPRRVEPVETTSTPKGHNAVRGILIFLKEVDSELKTLLWCKLKIDNLI